MPLSVVPLCKKMNKATCMCACLLLQGTESSGSNQGGQLGGEYFSFIYLLCLYYFQLCGCSDNKEGNC